MATPILSRILRPLGKFSASTGRVIHAYKPIALAVTATIATYWLGRAYIYEFSPATGASMEPTIPGTLNMVGVNKLYRRGKGIQIGDVVQIASPQQPNILSGKRVVGLPGDYVLRSRNRDATPGGAPLGGVTDWRKRIAQQNGEVVDEEEDEEWDEPEMIQVPEGHVWVQGDNMAWSRDSRLYGAVPMALIKGRSGWYSTGPFSYTSLHPGKGLHKVDEWEVAAVLGEENDELDRSKKR